MVARKSVSCKTNHKIDREKYMKGNSMRGYQPTMGTGAPRQTPDQGTSGRRSTVPERDSGVRITALEARLAALEARLAALESDRYQYKPATSDCGCPLSSTCNSVACPRVLFCRRLNNES